VEKLAGHPDAVEALAAFARAFTGIESAPSLEAESR
jgi:hypothetical protein